MDAIVLSRNLEKSLHRALAHANDRRHEFATLEHLLLALTEDQDAIAVLCACSVDLDRLRGDLLTYVDKELGNLVAAQKHDAKPTASFQRVLQRAAIHVQSSGREEVTGANVLVAMFAERESEAVYFLQEQDMTRSDAVNYISHGIAKASGQRIETGSGGRSNEIYDLTQNELLVLDLLRTGRSNKLIAVQLKFQESTVKVHVRNIMKKLHVVDRTQFADQAALAEPAAFKAHLAALRKHEWVVYAKRPFGGPDAVLAYLPRYTHRIAIANSRLVAFDGERVQLGLTTVHE